MESIRRVMTAPLPYMAADNVTRFLCRALMCVSRRRMVRFDGIDKIMPDKDPFIVVPNHNMRLEAVLLPSTLMFYRAGKRVHFMADWPFLLVPFVASLYRRSHVIPITNKDARVKLLNRFRHRFHRGDPFQLAADKIEYGSPVGIFIEGTMNRHPEKLLRGHYGAARLALRTGVDVIPIGVRFPRLKPAAWIGDLSLMSIEVGDPIQPSGSADNRANIKNFHETVMMRLSALCGKQWNWSAEKRRYHE